MPLKDWAITAMRKEATKRDMAFEQMILRLDTMKESILEDIKEQQDAQYENTKLVENDCKQLQAMLHEHMDKDPVPPERVELIKCEIENELEEAVSFQNPLLRKRKSALTDEQMASGAEITDVQSNSVNEEMIGDLAAQI